VITGSVPRRVCPVCQEYLPHSCAPLVIIRRPKWKTRRVVEIIDR